MSPDELTAFLHANIPLTSAMQLRVDALDAQGLSIRAPLDPNRNHHGTAFGGSLATLAIVAGWAAIHHGLAVTGIDASLVVRHAELDYARPVRGELVASCRLPAVWADFVAALRAGRRARLSVTSDVRCQTQPGQAVQLQARYVAIPAATED